MTIPWQEDFTYQYLRRMLQIVEENYSIVQLGDAEYVFQQPRPKSLAFIRHDVDLDLEAARNVALIEKGLGICSTYMILAQNQLYDLNNRINKNIIDEIFSMDHEIGLHADLDVASSAEIKSLEKSIEYNCCLLEDLIGHQIKSVSFHRPLPQLLRGPIRLANRINAYAKELMEWYLSDSKGIWREGEPITAIENPRKRLQLLIHPIWWGEIHALPEDRLQVFFESRTAGYNENQKKQFDQILEKQLSVRRRGILEV